MGAMACPMDSGMGRHGGALQPGGGGLKRRIGNPVARVGARVGRRERADFDASRGSVGSGRLASGGRSTLHGTGRKGVSRARRVRDRLRDGPRKGSPSGPADPGGPVRWRPSRRPRCPAMGGAWGVGA
jgi:hypothetical protein